MLSPDPKAAITPETLKVRLFGIDAPEMRDWPLGAHARAEMDKLVPAAGVARVTCRVLDRDSHGRPVALCAAGLHRDLGAAMIAAGGAVPHRLYLHGPDAPVGLAARYDAAEAEARAARRGIWLDYYGD